MKTFYELEAEGAFKNNVPYPNKGAATKYCLYYRGAVIAKDVSQSEKDDLKKIHHSALVESYYDEKSFKLQAKRYREEHDRIHQLFKDCLFEEFGVVNNPKRDMCFDLAWRKDNSFSGAYGEFSELVELIKWEI